MLSRRVRVLYERAAAEDLNLGGRGLLDLCADLVPRATRADLKAAILVSGIEVACNDRIRAEIDSLAVGGTCDGVHRHVSPRVHAYERVVDPRPLSRKKDV
jgi:hypothetical protein